LEDKTMRKLARGRRRLQQTDFERHIEAILETIHQELPPGHELDYVVINMETKEYVLGNSPSAAMDAFEKRWPDGGFFACRADGGPFSKMYRGKR